MKREDAYLNFLRKYLTQPDALLWVMMYTLYVHAIDDIIDGDKTDSEHILKTFEYAAVLFSNEFYLRNIALLYPIVKIVTNSYADSVQMERSNVPWRRQAADVLRQTGNDMILMCIEICSDIDTRVRLLWNYVK